MTSEALETVQGEETPGANRTRTARAILESILPWAAFLAFMIWAWGPWPLGRRDLFHTVSHYGDSFETIVTSSWFSDALAHGQNPLIYPFNFFPEGWRVASHSVGTLLYVGLVPLVRLSGAVFTYNLVMILNCALGFAGALLLARRHLTALPATIIALAVAFWSMRWNQAQDGRLQVFLASTALPWMLWGVDRAFASATRRGQIGWLVFAGMCWALAFNITLYFVFVGGVLLAAWILPQRGGAIKPWPRRLLALGLVVAVMLLLGAPWLALNLHESAIAQAPFYTIDEVNFSGASLNSLPVPYLNHPWLGRLARQLYRGEVWEQGVANLGLVGCALAMVGIVLGRKRRAWLPALCVAVLALVCALGLTLHWNGQPVQSPIFRPLNAVIWHLGHALKPDFFITPSPPSPFADAVPLPGFLLTAMLPFWERGRMFARYALAASIGVLILAGIGLVEIGRLWPRRPVAARVAQLLLAGLLLFEAIPAQVPILPFPPAGHAAFTWLRQQSLGDQGIANVFAAHKSTIVLSNHGYSLLAPSFTGAPTVAGAAGVRPKHNAALNDWLATHEHPFWNTDFARILRAYKVRYLLLEMQGDWEKGLWQEAQAGKDLKPLQCYPAPDGESPWPWPICIAEVPPEPHPSLNMLMHEGWSGMEDWGLWAEGVEARSQFVLTHQSPVRIALEAFPLCVEGKPQHMWIDVNGLQVVDHLWPDCKPWKSEVLIPADKVQIGFNDVTVRAAFAERPPDSAAQDLRQLSVGFTQLQAIPQP